MRGRSDPLAYARRTRPSTTLESGDRVAAKETKERLHLLEDRDHDLQLEKVVGHVLRYGSLVSVTIVVVGIALMAWSALFRSQGLPAVPTAGYAAPFRSPAGLLADLRAGDPSATISVGLMVLIATPVIRVASTVVYFLLHRDKPYLAITSFVLLVLIAGFLVGSEG